MQIKIEQLLHYLGKWVAEELVYIAVWMICIESNGRKVFHTFHGLKKSRIQETLYVYLQFVLH